MRVEQRTEWVPEWGDRGFHLIALQFRHLPTLHLRAIQNGLRGRVHDEHEVSFQSLRRAHAIAFTGLCVALVVSMFAMTTPLEVFSKLVNLR